MERSVTPEPWPRWPRRLAGGWGSTRMRSANCGVPRGFTISAASVCRVPCGRSRSALTGGEWEQARLHSYHSERLLARIPALADLARIAASDHERLDGSGYHRGLSAAQLPAAARVLAVADAWCAMAEPRAYRTALASPEAAAVLREEARAGKLGGEAVDAVLESVGERAVPVAEAPAGLTAREVEVLRLLARGLTNKQTAQQLAISPKTVGRHIESIYSKIGASTRAAAALFAVEHGLLAP